MRDLGGSSSTAYAINNSGMIAGVSWMQAGSPNRAGQEHAVLWDAAGSLHDLGTLPGDYKSYAHGINDDGQVVGWSNTYGGPERPIVWKPETGMQELQTLGGYLGRANAINNAGLVVGWSLTPDALSGRPLLWAGAVVKHDLGLVEQRSARTPNAINDVGQVVGDSTNPAPGRRYQPFVWDEANGSRVLQDLLAADDAAVWVIDSALGIDADGRIVGRGWMKPAGLITPHAVLLTPRVPSAATQSDSP
jgi:probable HAF family extracellular repeat protein